MASYFDEHHNGNDNGQLHFARLLVEGGFAEFMGVDFDRLFPEKARPACPHAVEALVTINAKDVRDPNGQCPICIDIWKNAAEDEKLIKMPCDHLFHSRCIRVWLEKANTCPACRHEMRSSDELYEEWKRQQKRKVEREVDLEELHNSMFS